MSFIDPTYLRYVYDGLQTGEVSSENPSVLPNGLVGVYEEAFVNSTAVNHRSKILQFFSVWALFKKEVSAAFLLPLLSGWTEEQVFECIAEYSRWFNSPVSGKYQIYHERLRTFILQRDSAEELGRCNESIIRICHAALATKSNDEWDVYALEHLSTHLMTPAMEGLDSASLKTLAYDTAHWNRQIDISKGYDWTKKMHNEMMLWASKFDDEQVMECALNKVDLYHMEQNDALRIVELIAQNEIETALSRIESFGGNDRDGIQRKFILYMLCLMELTLLDSKHKYFKRDAIERLLKHMDDHLLLDNSILNWKDFFPDNLMFKMVCELEKIGLEYVAIKNRTEEWDLENHRLSNVEYDSRFRFEALSDKIKKNITYELERQDYFADKSFDILKVKKIIEDISNPIDKFWSLSFISYLLNQNGAKDKAAQLLLDSVVLADNISNECEKCLALAHLSSELMECDNITVAIELVMKSYHGALQIEDEFRKASVTYEISPLLVKLGRLSEALKCAEVTSKDLFGNWSIIQKIINELVINNNINESRKILLESLESKKGIFSHWTIYRVITSISIEFIKKGKINESLSCLKGLDSNYMVSTALKEMALLMTNLGMNENSRKLLQEALKSAYLISEINSKNLALAEISEAMAIEGSFEDSLRLSEVISVKSNKNFALHKISIEMAKVGKIDDALICIKGISASHRVSNALKSISLVLANQGRNILAIEIANMIKDDFQKYKTLILVSTIIFRQGKESDSEDLMLEILSLCRNLPDLKERITSILSISSEFSKQMKIVESEAAMQEAIDYSLDILDEEDRDLVLKQICHYLAKQNKYEQALLHYQKISDESEKENTKILISIELAALGNIDASEKVFNQILQINNRQICWKSIAEKEYNANGYFNSISFCNNFLNDEARFYIRQNISHLLDTSTISPQVLLYEIKTLGKDLSSLEYILQLYAINQLFFGNFHQDKLVRYNNVLNFQWAINIKNTMRN
jgi:tetratricopeptide (TPR) repeat protein